MEIVEVKRPPRNILEKISIKKRCSKYINALRGFWPRDSMHFPQSCMVSSEIFLKTIDI